MTRAVTIVVPVYADWQSLKDCLEALAETVDTAKHKIMLVNDSGPEADELEKNIKQFIAGREGYEYNRNSKNLGFVGTCNRAALELDKSGNHILLLNSDTKPTTGWLEEMLDVLSLSPKNATVTARSNNASIATVPLSQAVHHGLQDSKTAYAIYERISPKLPRYYDAPVGLGYCLLIRREVIDKFGLFDKVFQKGYGEEVDFCRRIKRQGWCCIFANRAFVFHLEARSFTPEVKQKMMDSHNEIIWKRYPEYRQEVRDWMDEKVPAETAIEKAAGFNAEPPIYGVRALLKRSPLVYKIARSIYRRLLAW